MADTNIEPKLAEIYNTNFYENLVTTSADSARIYLKFLWQFLQPVSVLDVGCGRGTWLKACHELGAKNLFGFDGDWNDQSSMVDKDIKFTSVDLNKPFSVPEKIDLVINLEVAEHLEPSTAPQLIKCLTSASDAVLFSAAYTKQEGTNHINERPHTYWADLFGDQNFVPFDLFRPVFWGNEDVSFWYRQNTFLYLRRNSNPYQQVIAHEITELSDLSFMNCIHPNLYNRKIAQSESFRSHIVDFVRVSVVRWHAA